MKTLMRCRIMRRLIRVYTVCSGLSVQRHTVNTVTSYYICQKIETSPFYHRLLDEWQIVQTLIRHHVQLWIWVNTVCSGQSVPILKCYYSRALNQLKVLNIFLFFPQKHILYIYILIKALLISINKFTLITIFINKLTLCMLGKISADDIFKYFNVS